MSFPLSKTDYKPSRYNNLQITPMGSAFFIAPFVNALVRSGEQEEKELITIVQKDISDYIQLLCEPKENPSPTPITNNKRGGGVSAGAG